MSPFKYFLFLLTLFSIADSDIVIKNNVVWSRNMTINENVVIKPNGTLTINSGVEVSVNYIDKDSNNIGDIYFLIEGSLLIYGSLDSKVIIGPKKNSKNKKHWRGLVFEKGSENSNINFLSITSADTGISIRTKVKLDNIWILESESMGLVIDHVVPDSIELNNINILRTNNIGMLVKNGNVFLSWGTISGSKGLGILNNKRGIIKLKKFNIFSNNDNGITNFGTITMFDGIIKNNRHGILSSNGTIVLTNGTIQTNNGNGILACGNSKIYIESSTIKDNKGYAIETTDWMQNDYHSNWTEEGNPLVNVRRSNFIDNYKTVILDEYRYDNIWQDWLGIEYSGEGWVKNWEEYIFREIPFGNLAWIGFRYNSNDGGSNFTWQPCTGSMVSSPVFEVKNSRDISITYLSAPFHCSYNPLAGENSNKWNKYSEYIGEIDSSTLYKDWYISKKYIASTNKYILRQFFDYTYLPGNDSNFVVRPSIKDFVLSFYHGGYEVSSYSDNSLLSFVKNFWGTDTTEIAYINPYGTPGISLHNRSEVPINDAGSFLENKDLIKIISPLKDLSYEDIKYHDINWKTNGLIPLIDIDLSIDDGKSWESIAKQKINNGLFSWWNNLIIGDKFFIKISNSEDPNISSIIGPCGVKENTTPILKITDKNLNFITGQKQKKLSIRNIGGGDLSWEIIPEAKWIVLSRNKGVAKKKSLCTVRVNRTGLTTGKYNSKILVKTNHGQETIYVHLVVAKPSLYVDTKFVSFDSTISMRTFNLKNYGGGTLSWKIITDHNWLKLEPENGSSKTGAIVKVHVDRSRLKKGENFGSIELMTNAGNKTIKISAYGNNVFAEPVKKQNFNPWQWMYDYGVY